MPFASDPAPLALTSLCTHISNEIIGENQIEHNASCHHCGCLSPCLYVGIVLSVLGKQHQPVEAGDKAPGLGHHPFYPTESTASLTGSLGVILAIATG